MADTPVRHAAQPHDLAAGLPAETAASQFSPRPFEHCPPASRRLSNGASGAADKSPLPGYAHRQKTSEARPPEASLSAAGNIVLLLRNVQQVRVRLRPALVVDIGDDDEDVAVGGELQLDQRI